MTNYIRIVSVEIGNIADNVVSITFSNQIVSFDFSAGITIKVNGVSVSILSSKRLNNQKTFQYTISQSVLSSDTVTFSYLALPSALSGLVKSSRYGDYTSSEYGTVLLEDTGELTVTNNVPSNDPIGNALRARCKLYYKFDESSGDLADSSGNGNTLNVFSGVTEMISAKINNGLYINSLHAQTGRANTNGLSLYPNSYTIDFWIKFTEIILEVNEYPIWGKSGPDETDWEFGAYVQNVSDSPISCIISFYTYANAISSSALLENVFYYIIIERNNDEGNFNIYVNNVLAFTSSILDGDVNIENAPFYFGDIKSSLGTEKFIIDEFGIFSNVFSSEERDYRYNSGMGRMLYP